MSRARATAQRASSGSFLTDFEEYPIRSECCTAGHGFRGTESCQPQVGGRESLQSPRRCPATGRNGRFPVREMQRKEMHVLSGPLRAARALDSSSICLSQVHSLLSTRQMQTRSADEPMTTFVTCLNCNNRQVALDFAARVRSDMLNGLTMCPTAGSFLEIAQSASAVTRSVKIRGRIWSSVLCKSSERNDSRAVTHSSRFEFWCHETGVATFHKFASNWIEKP